MKFSISDFEFKPCTDEDLQRILELQEDAFLNIESSDILRRNDPEMLRECLQKPNFTIGAWHKGRLIAFSVLYFPTDDSERLALSLEGVDFEGLKDANYKLCIVDKNYRGNSLQYELGTRLLEYAAANDVKIVCSTASPKNKHSISNIEKMGFSHNRTLTKYGFSRALFYKFL